MNTLEAIKQEIATREAAQAEVMQQLAPIVAERELTLPDRFRALVSKVKRRKVEGSASTKPIESTPVNQFRMIAAASVAGLMSIGALQFGQASGDYFLLRSHSRGSKPESS
jgi:hypothetical protein